MEIRQAYGFYITGVELKVYFENKSDSVDICNFTAEIVLKYRGILSLDCITKTTLKSCFGVKTSPQIRVHVTENYFSYFSTKTYVVGAQKNRLDETVLMSTQNTCLI